MFKTTIAAALVAVFTLGSMTALHAQSRQTTPMIKDPSVIEYTFRPYGSIVIAAMVREIDGKTAVCGFWSVKQRLQAYIIESKMDRRARQTTAIQLGNKRLLTGVSFMNKVALDDFVVGTQAKCEVTPVPWQPGFSRQKIEFLSPTLRGRG